MTETQVATPIDIHPVGDLVDLARRGEWDELEETWLAAVGRADFWRDAPEFAKLFSLVKTRRNPGTVTAMLELMLSELAEREDTDPRQVLAVFERGYPHGPASRAMREALASIGRRVMDDAMAEGVIERAGLLDDNQTAKGAVDQFLLYYRLVPGEVFLHQYYHIGIITEVDMTGGLLKMDFPDTTYRNIPVKFEHLEELLRPVPAAHFDAVRLSRPEDVRRLAEDAPGLLVRQIAEARHGEIVQSDIKRILTTGVFTDAEFKNWWGKRRAEVVRDPYLDVTGAGAKCRFKLRERPKPYYQELLAALLEAKDMRARLECVRSIVRAARDDAFPAEAWEKAVAPFQKAAIEIDELGAAERIGWGLLAREMEKAGPVGATVPVHVDAVALLRAAARPSDVLVALEHIDHLAAMIPSLREAYPDTWPEQYKQLAERVPPRLAEALLKDLIEAGRMEAAVDALGRIISFPERNPDAYLWAMKGLLEGSLAHIPVGLDRSHLIEDLLNELEALENGPPAPSPTEEKDRRTLAQKITKFLSDRHFKVLADLIEQAPLAEANAFYRSLDQRRLPQDLIESMRAALRKTRNDLEDEPRAAAKRGAEANVLLCLDASLTAKKAEYRRINDSEIPANSKAIGAAAELGDLRENAEYHSAKEHQKILFRRVEELSVQIGRARVVTADAIDTAKIGFGVKVALKDLGDGSERDYQILGPWESDPAHGTISYQSPLGQSFVGRRVGEVFEVKLPDGAQHRLEVLKIEKAL